MLLEFKTKANINGNVYKLIIDINNNKYQHGYFIVTHNAIETTKKEIKEIISRLNESGYKEI